MAEERVNYGNAKTNYSPNYTEKQNKLELH